MSRLSTLALATLIGSAQLWIPTAAHAVTATMDVHFLNRDEGRVALTEGPSAQYFQMLAIPEMEAKTGLNLHGMSLLDAQARTRAAYAFATEDFTEAERAAMTEVLAAAQPMLARTAPLYTREPWSFIKIAGRSVEGGLPHTRGENIVLPDALLAQMSQLYTAGKLSGPATSSLAELLIHEQTHVMQRRHPDPFAGFYESALGFRRVPPIELPGWLRTINVVNPDGPSLEWIFPTEDVAGAQWALPLVVLSSTVKPRMPEDFSTIAVPVVQKGSAWAAVDQTEPTKLRQLQTFAAFQAQIPDHSEDFHPNEVTAVMISKIVVGASLPNPNDPLWAKTKAWMVTAFR